MSNVIKARNEYCHIDIEQIIITRSLKINDLVLEYAKSINNFYKIIMVFLIAIPIFAILSVVLYYYGKLWNINIS